MGSTRLPESPDDTFALETEEEEEALGIKTLPMPRVISVKGWESS